MTNKYYKKIKVNRENLCKNCDFLDGELCRKPKYLDCLDMETHQNYIYKRISFFRYLIFGGVVVCDG